MALPAGDEDVDGVTDRGAVETEGDRAQKETQGGVWQEAEEEEAVWQEEEEEATGTASAAESSAGARMTSAAGAPSMLSFACRENSSANFDI